LTQQETRLVFVLLVAAGNETTRSALAHSLHTLTQHRSEGASRRGLRGTGQDRHRRDRSLGVTRDLDAAHLVRRLYVVGVDLKAGEKVLLFLQLGHRDEDVFGRPRCL